MTDAPPPTPVPAGWGGILDHTEAILWQGRPDGAMTFHPGNILPVLFGLAFSGFALIWMIMAHGAGGLFWMVGLIHFSGGLVVIWLGLFHSAWSRRRSFYTLTDRRAIIAATTFTGKRTLKSYPITARSVLELTKDGAFSTLTFHIEHWRDSDGDPRTTDVSFERLRDGPQVLALMQQIQAGAG